MSTASTLLALYIEAETKILSGQAYTMGDRSLTMADLGMVQRERARLEQRVDAETRTAAGASSPRYQLADLS